MQVYEHLQTRYEHEKFEEILNDSLSKHKIY